MIIPGVLLGWILLIFSFLFVDFILDDVAPIFKHDINQYLEGTKKKWNKK